LATAGSLIDVVRERGRLTVASFMDLALYDPHFGYYARAGRRSGRTGDFFNSVDVGPRFGELLAVQVAEMAGLLDSGGRTPFDLVEAGAGSGRLSADILRAIKRADQCLFGRTRLHLVEASAVARAEQHGSLSDLIERFVFSDERLPESYEGVLFANELLDAFPVHQVVMRAEGLREVFVVTVGDRLATVEEAPSTPALAAYLRALGVSMQPGWRAEISLRAVDWVREASRRLRRGFIVLIDYGHEARDLYSETHAGGTLTSFSRHTATEPERGGTAPLWLGAPGEQDLTAHVDFTSVKTAAEKEGLETVALLDQTYFLFGLAGFGGAVVSERPPNLETAARRRAFATLTMPGGLGSTMKVLILAKGVGAPNLAGCSYKVRMT
jgi:SAM-dependent MidA family methyltransferase